MKNISILLLVAFSALAHGSQGSFQEVSKKHNQSPSIQGSKSPSNAKKYKPVDSRKILEGFEGYTLVPELKASFQSNGDRRMVPSGIKSIPNRLAANTVVKSRLTGKLEIVTGILSIYTTDASALSSSAAKMGMKLVQSMDGGNIQLLECPFGSDILAIKKSIESVQGVKFVQIDRLGEKERPM